MVQPRRVDGARLLGNERKPTLVAIGNFDGVHGGHRAVLQAASEDARAGELSLVVLTFHPHPAEVLGKGGKGELTPLDRKVELLCALDPNLYVVVEPFTKELAAMSPREFAEDLLVAALGARVVVVGQNFRFGRERAGDLNLLAKLGDELGFEALVEPLSQDSAGPISSSRIRAAIAAGDLVSAERWLGRPHALSGVIVRGDGRGRTIGVPTANLDQVVEAKPPHGVYACLVDRLDDEGAPVRLSTGVANIGNRPTVGAGFSVEAYLHDFDGDLYGARLRLHLLERIRDEQKFGSLDALVTQIRLDIETARVRTRDRTSRSHDGRGWY